jgi:type I restriction enzyme M protein
LSDGKDIVQSLWSLCHILRDDGITFHQYVNELSYLLFLKMAEEIATENDFPIGFRWRDLVSRSGNDQFDFYRTQLVALGTRGTGNVRTIFANPTSLLRHPESLNLLVARINELDWYSAKKEGLGDLYEGLLQRNASEKKSGAGQYFTPRPLIEAIVSVLRPSCHETIQDPAAGTGGFLVVANEYARRLAAKLEQGPTFFASELVQDVHRLLLMNVILHGMNGNFILGDTLSTEGADQLPSTDLILTNPPFGNKRGSSFPGRSDLPFPTSNKQLAFLQHVYLKLKPGGRAAAIVPDNVLFEGNVGAQVRRDLMDRCNLHTILRLPHGIFYANVTTNVLFFTRSSGRVAGVTESVWIYDMRANMPVFGKRTPLRREHFHDFELAYGADPYGIGQRADQGQEGRFRCFSRDQIRERSDNLDITWLRDESAIETETLSEPESIAADIRARLEAILEEIDALAEQLACDGPGDPDA